jgi:hypothetical protein
MSNLRSIRWFSPGVPVSSTNKTDRHDITEILLKVALSTINQTNKHQIHKHVIGTDRIGSCNPTAPLLIYMRVAANKESTEPTEEFLVIKLKSSIRKF